MSIQKAARPTIKVKPLSTTSLTHISSPALTQDSGDTKVDTRSEVFEDKSDEEMTDYVAPRPLSVAIPRAAGFSTTGPYCPRRPNLSDILANNSPPPWTLSAFMAYLSQNHCLETLEFTMDASRYRKHYSKMLSRSGGEFIPGTNESNYMLSLWQKLLEAYIVPNGPREVNIPSIVRDDLLDLAAAETAPDPSVLDVAVEKIYELMEESVLVPFLNSFYPQTAHPDSHSNNTSNEDLNYPVRATGEHLHYRRSIRKERRSSPTMAASAPSSATVLQNRSSAPSSFQQFARSLSQSNRNTSATSDSSKFSQGQSARSSGTAVLSPWSSNQSGNMAFTPVELAAGLTDDASGSSPSALGEPMTPPTTPPQCDFGSPESIHGGSRSSSSHGGSTWKKMRSSFTFKKKSGSLREEELDRNGNLI